MQFELNMIVAVGNKTAKGFYPIGKKGGMPWNCKEDLQWFKEVTMGYPVIMGRKTFESIKKPLIGRLNIVISKTSYENFDNVYYVKSVEEAIELAKEKSEKAFIIGGGSIYNYVLEKNYIDNIYVDELDIDIDNADTHIFFDFKKSPSWTRVGRRIEIVEDVAYASVYEKLDGYKNNVDSVYLELCKKILKEGTKKKSRAGNVYSLFGQQLRFNLKDGLPMLTTKKMFSKGVIHELLWFLKGDTNIKYLVDNNVHIWDDDAYRYYLELNKEQMNENVYDKETFLKMVRLGSFSEKILNRNKTQYYYGDLGPVYGAQWTNWNSTINQINNVIETLKKNPDDRRIMISAWNPSDIPNMALPPCHYGCQFYTTEMTLEERIKYYKERIYNGEVFDMNYYEYNSELFDKCNVPKRKLSCMWNQRSVDGFLGFPFNLLSYSLLTHMVAQCVNMDVNEIIFNGGDIHIYENQIPSLLEQLERNPHKYSLPRLELNPKINNIEDFKYDDIKIVDYKSYKTIKAPLSVGL